MMNNMIQTIRRGDIFYAANMDIWDPKAARPVIILSSDVYNMSNDRVSVVPLSLTAAPDKTSHIEVQCKGKTSIALCERLTSIPKNQLKEYVKTVCEEEMNAIENGVLEVLSISAGIAVPPTRNTEQPALKAEQPTPAAEQPLPPAVDEEKIKIMAERDVYKTIYTELLLNVLAS